MSKKCYVDMFRLRYSAVAVRREGTCPRLNLETVRGGRRMDDNILRQNCSQKYFHWQAQRNYSIRRLKWQFGNNLNSKLILNLRAFQHSMLLIMSRVYMYYDSEI